MPDSQSETSANLPRNGLLGLQDVVLYTYSEGGYIHCFEARRYSERPLILRGYLKGDERTTPTKPRREAVFRA